MDIEKALRIIDSIPTYYIDTRDKNYDLINEAIEYLKANVSKSGAMVNPTEEKDKLYQCPYDKATKCRMDEPCKGCETWAIALRENAKAVQNGDKAIIQLLTNAVYVMSKGKCKCGNPPYDNGNLCNVCFAMRTLEDVKEIKSRFEG